MKMRHASTTWKKRLMAQSLMRRYSLSSAVETVKVLGEPSSPIILVMICGKQRLRVLMISSRQVFGREIQITLLNDSCSKIGWHIKPSAMCWTCHILATPWCHQGWILDWCHQVNLHQDCCSTLSHPSWWGSEWHAQQFWRYRYLPTSHRSY